MSDNTQKPRQFWIHATGMAYEFDVMSDSPTTHVIEYQAFQEVCRAATAEAEGNVLLQKKNQALEEKLKESEAKIHLYENISELRSALMTDLDKRQHYSALEIARQNLKLAKDLQKAVEALEFYSNKDKYVRGSADGLSAGCCAITEEGGKLARETLKEIKL